MGKIVLVLVVAIQGCAPMKQPHRWPDHRHQHDEQLEQLQTRANQLEASEHQMFLRMEALEKELARLKSAVPSPGT